MSLRISKKQMIQLYKMLIEIYLLSYKQLKFVLNEIV